MYVRTYFFPAFTCTYLMPSVSLLCFCILKYNIMLCLPSHKTPPSSSIPCLSQKAPEYVEEDLSLAKRHGFCYGAKLVRGAYMEQERDRAKEKKLDDPIHSTKEDTDRCYHNTVSRLMEEAKDGNVGFMVASHNTESAKHAVDE